MYAVLLAGDNTVCDVDVLKCADMYSEIRRVQVGDSYVVEPQVADIVECKLVGSVRCV